MIVTDEAGPDSVALVAGFSSFYAATAPRMVQQLFLLTGDLSRAQECVHDAYAQAWRQWEQLSGGDPAAWVRRVAWRLAVSDWRRRAAFWRAAARHGPPRDADAPSADAVAVRDALAQLDRKQREALVLHYFADLPVQDIADLLGVPTGTVKARLARGRKALAPLLADSPITTEGPTCATT